MEVQRAYRLHAYGGPECIKFDQDVPIPKPGPSEVLIAVSKVGVNPFDWKIREGYVKDVNPLQLPAILGVDFSGQVVATGNRVSRFKAGDRVMTMSTALGAYAERIVVDEKILAHVPEALSDTDAATLPIPGLTAWQSLHAAGNVRAGITVLVHGASGTSGAFAVQFAKAAGAIVIGTASAKNREYVLSLGAEKFIDYQTQKFEDHVKDVDLVLDYSLIGGTGGTTERSWAVLKPEGAIVSVADPSVMASAPPGRRGIFPQIWADATKLEEIAKQLVAGKLKSKVAKVYRRDQLWEALRTSQMGGTTGRLILDFQQ